MFDAHHHINAHADSLIAILAAQCADLESLLVLARREREAIEDAAFDDLLGIVEERARLGNRLEIHHRRIADLRELLNDDSSRVLPPPSREYAANVSKLINRIRTEDARAHKLLSASREQIIGEQQRLTVTQRRTSAYLRDARPASVACDALC